MMADREIWCWIIDQIKGVNNISAKVNDPYSVMIGKTIQSGKIVTAGETAFS